MADLGLEDGVGVEYSTWTSQLKQNSSASVEHWCAASELGELVVGRRHVDPPFFRRKVRLAGWGRIGGTHSHGPSRESGEARSLSD